MRKLLVWLTKWSLTGITLKKLTDLPLNALSVQYLLAPIVFVCLFGPLFCLELLTGRNYRPIVEVSLIFAEKYEVAA